MSTCDLLRPASGDWELGSGDDSGWIRVDPLVHDDDVDEQIEQEDIDRLLLFDAVWAEWNDADGDASTDV